MDYKETIANNEYKGRPMQEVLIEVAVMQKVMMQDIVSIKNDLADLKNRKVDKTEMTTWEVRIANIEKSIISLNQWKWRVVGVASGIGLFIGIIFQIYNYLK